MKTFLITALLFLFPLSSHALFEIRAGYGNNMLAEDNYVDAGAGITATLDNGAGLNLDFIFEPPLITDLGIGLRYEIMKYDYNTTLPAVLTGDADLKRLSLLLNYRLIDLFAYFGLIGTFNLDASFDTNVAGNKTSFDTDFIWTAGVEGGVNLGLLSVGAEVGKMFANAQKSGQQDIELGGLYGKILVGFGF